jgi:hypothetical protein
MNPILIGVILAVGLVALFLMVFRPTKAPPVEGRPDELEPHELRGPEQHKQRELP